MKLIAFLNPARNKNFRESVGENFYANGGYANGYVAVPPEHPYHYVDYDKVLVRVHGGLTFDSEMERINKCNLKDEWSIEILEGEASIPDDWWVFGFDTLHCNDSLNSWPRERCIEETLRLKEQLEKMSNNIVFK